MGLGALASCAAFGLSFGPRARRCPLFEEPNGVLSVPGMAELNVEVAVQICGRLLGSALRVDPATWRLARRLAQDVTYWVDHQTRPHITFMVGDWASRERLITTVARARAFDLSQLKRELPGLPPAPAVLATALALAWQDPALRGELEPGLWRRVLAGFHPEPVEVVEAPPPGFIRVVLFPPQSEDHTGPLGGNLRLELVLLSKRSGTPLKPRSAPRSVEALDKRARLSEGDRRVCRLAEQRRLLGHIFHYRYGDSASVSAEISHLDGEIVAALGAVSEVVFHERTVEVRSEVWRPCLRVSDGPNGGLTLDFVEQPLGHIQLAASYVIRAAEAPDRAWLQPLAADVPHAVERALYQHAPMPTIPASEVPAFLGEFLTRTALPVEVRARALGVQRCPVKPRLLLTEEDGLEVRVRFGYDEVEVTPGSEGDVLQAPDGRLLQRDRGAEVAAIAELNALLPRPVPTRLEGEESFDFLLDGLPKLVNWTVFLDDKARKRRPRGTVAVSMQAQSTTDWFDLQVDFAIDGKAVRTEQILEAWTQGRRYVELSDGRIARLPAEWLRRHAGTLSELEEVRQAARHQLGAFAAPLVSELMGEVAGAAAMSHWRAVAERVEAFDRVPERDVPAGLKATLRDYQHKGYRWLCALHELGLGGVLADDMGLGKTVQALAFLVHVHETKGLSSLVVAPTSVVPNWASEVKRFAPGLKVALHHGSNRGAPPEDADLVITSYALLRIDRELLAARAWRVVLLDEAQAIKNPASQLAEAARSLQAKTRLAMTGTPVENHLMELWSQFQFMMPGFFGSRAAFGRRYANPVQRNDQDALSALRRRMRPFVLRRLKDEVARELPPRQEQILYCELGPAQRRLYEKVRETWRATVLGAVESKGVGGATLQVLEALMRLRQVCCDPHLLPATEAAGVDQAAKLDRLMELVEALAEEGHRALVFSQWPSLLKRVVPRLEAKKIKYLYLDGSTKERGDLQTRWNEADGPPVFLISLKAGGTGMNLVGADHVIHLDPWWNPAVEQQATDRAHRIGQTRPVMVYKLVARGTVEEKILELQARKKALAEATIDAERMVVDALTREDLEAVFSAQESEAIEEVEAAEEEPAPALEAPPHPKKAKARPRLRLVPAAAPDEADEAEEAEEASAIEPPAAVERTATAPDGLPTALLKRLMADGRLTTTSAMEALGADRVETQRQLNAWVEAGLLEARGQTRGRHFVQPAR